jgi:VanZ family protein
MPLSDRERNSFDARTRRTIVLFVAAYWCVWVGFTHWPKIELPMISGMRLDKVGHFGGYTILAFLLSLMVAICWRAGTKLTRWDALGVWLTIALGGILDEWTQPYFGRSFEWGDYAADLSGGLLGIAIAAAVLSYRRAQQRFSAGT